MSVIAIFGSKCSLLIRFSSSEADSQILSDYVLALLQAESSQGELRVNAVENLNDFLGNSMDSQLYRTL